MKKQGFIIYIIALTIILGCEKNEDTSKGSLKVSGFITYNNEPIENVNITIDDKYNLSAATDANGYFEISGVAKGDHQLHIIKELSTNLKSTQQDTSIFSEKTIDISVNEDTELNNLRLPKAVKLDDPKNITESSAGINWNPTDDSEFREYKLYRHNSSGLDESTGTLVHVSTSINDTSFMDEALNPLQTYFYRIYVMDDFGRIGGSNIINLTTNNIQIILNGGFEDVTTNIPTDWSLTPNDIVFKSTKGNVDNYIKIDSIDAYAGNNSLEFHHAEESGCWEMWISQTIDKNSLVAGATYNLSLKYKSDFISNSNLDLILRNSTIDLWLNAPIQFNDDGEWKELSYEFGLPSEIGNNNIKLDLHFCIAGINSWWLDEVKIERVE